MLTVSDSYMFLSVCLQVSKDVRKLRVFEQTLLSSYQQFLTLLDRTAKGMMIIVNYY